LYCQIESNLESIICIFEYISNEDDAEFRQHNNSTIYVVSSPFLFTS